MWDYMLKYIFLKIIRGEGKSKSYKSATNSSVSERLFLDSCSYQEVTAESFKRADIILQIVDNQAD